MRIHCILVLASVLAARAAGQGFNLDVGPATSPSLPPSTYGAAAAQAGAWNLVPTGEGPVSLVDLSGAPSGVVMMHPYMGAFDTNDQATTGGDHDLLGDECFTDYVPPIVFSGLAPGDYLLYTYAWNSALPEIGNYVSVDGSSDPVQLVVGPWPGTFVQGNTYALHHVHVGAVGTLTLNVQSAGGFTDPILNAIQIVPDVPPNGFTLCEPGVGGVIACPCANPPSGSDRGCDNSSATGGAMLTVHGTASLAGDTLLLSTNGEPPTSTSVVSQGDATVSSVPFGQGVRCVGGHLKRLYTKAAAGGHVSAPGIGDAKISARSAQLGDVIAPGTQRYYYVYYRDPHVLGGCTSASTFNTTQSGAVTWAP
jgi:hypothetical protein